MQGALPHQAAERRAVVNGHTHGTDNVAWLRSWIRWLNRQDNHGLSAPEMETAAVIGAEAFEGRVPVERAAEIGAKAAKRLRVGL